jgi:hypothetical protein
MDTESTNRSEHDTPLGDAGGSDRSNENELERTTMQEIERELNDMRRDPQRKDLSGRVEHDLEDTRKELREGGTLDV